MLIKIALTPNVNLYYHTKEYVQRKLLSQLIYNILNNVYIITHKPYVMVLKTYLSLATLFIM